MANLAKQKTPADELPPEIRITNFNEVAAVYSPADAVNEASRCLDCKHKPCVSGCPVGVPIPDFIRSVTAGDFEQAYKIITAANSLPAVCGRVCPQENQCEKLCVRAKSGESVAIGRLERFCADTHMATVPVGSDVAPSGNVSGQKVAVIGSGPAGLTCAGELAARGYAVDLYEALHTPGGVLVYGIPEFRLPKEIVEREIENIKRLGVKILTNMPVGRIITVGELLEDGYKAVFIGSGAGSPVFLGIPGENLNRVFSANEYLTRINLMKAYLPEYDTPIIKSRNVAVIGGGNVAMDAARCAKRLGAENVYIVYRRGEEELPARAEEVHHAKEEGIIFRLLTNPIEITGDADGFAVGLKCVEMTLGEADASGRRRPVTKPGSDFFIEADTVILAIGTTPNPILHATTQGLEADSRGCIVTKEDGITTTHPGVFAGGDIVTGAATVISAMGAGKKAAALIDKYIQDTNS